MEDTCNVSHHAPSKQKWEHNVTSNLNDLTCINHITFVANHVLWWYQYEDQLPQTGNVVEIVVGCYKNQIDINSQGEIGGDR